LFRTQCTECIAKVDYRCMAGACIAGMWTIFDCVDVVGRGVKSKRQAAIDKRQQNKRQKRQKQQQQLVEAMQMSDEVINQFINQSHLLVRRLLMITGDTVIDDVDHQETFIYLILHLTYCCNNPKLE